MRRLASLVTILFLGYGLLRLVVGLALAGIELDLLAWHVLDEAHADVDRFLREKGERALVPFSALGYVLYIALMGLTLMLGAIGVLAGRSFGLPVIAVFLALWAGLFVNFLTVNRKLVQFGGFALLYLLLVWAKRGDRMRVPDPAEA